MAEEKKQEVVGRPTKYTSEHAKRAAALCLNGATNTDLADEFEVSIGTIHNWMVRYPEFLSAIKTNKDIADNRVERSLYHRAVGYSFDSEKVFGPTESRDAVRVPVREHVPPDVTAQIFWLKNRRPDLWRDRHEHTVGGTVLHKTADQLKQEFVDFVLQHGLQEAMREFLPPMIEGVVDEER